MAYQNKVIVNPAVGLRIKFLQTANDTKGELLEMEATYRAGSKEPPQHYHPSQEEEFTIIRGEMRVRIDGELQVLRQGDSLRIPANKSHSMWNNSDGESTMNWKVRPALTTEYLLETFAGLAVDGKTDQKGTPKFLQIVLIANKYANVFRLSKPAYILQRIIFSMLAPFAYIAGYKPAYQKYFS
jgi:quercetin dioxygenase-like cupin family protein